MGFFIWLEETALSVWVRESPELWAFPFILYLHTLGMALIAGLSSAVALSILVLPGSPRRPPLAGLFPLMWTGLAINAVSGLLLLIAYPAKALTNPVFYLKMIAIVAAVTLVHWLQRQLLAVSVGSAADTAGGTADAAGGTARPPASATDTDAAAGVASIPSAKSLKRAAAALLGLWIVATTAGRLLAYTYSILLATFDI